MVVLWLLLLIAVEIRGGEKEKPIKVSPLFSTSCQLLPKQCDNSEGIPSLYGSFTANYNRSAQKLRKQMNRLHLKWIQQTEPWRAKEGIVRWYKYQKAMQQAKKQPK